MTTNATGISFILTDNYAVDYHNILRGQSLGDQIQIGYDRADLDSDQMCCLVVELAVDGNNMPFIKDVTLVTTEMIQQDKVEQALCGPKAL